MKTGIYKIFNTATGKMYVGSAIDIDRRWADHKKLLKQGTHHSKKLQNSWLKHGPEAFEFSIIEFVLSKEELISREQYWIDAFECSGPLGYNISPTAFSLLGFRHSEESIEKCRAAKRGKPMIPHVMEALRKANTGRKLSEEHIAKVAASSTGRKKSAESIEKTASSHRGAKRSIETRMRISERAKGRKTFLGKSHSAETKLKISIAKTGKKFGPMSDEMKAKISAATTGKKKTRKAATEMGVRFIDLERNA
jgi:group I intron endonuclease